jgi:hypothetical protein
MGKEPPVTYLIGDWVGPKAGPIEVAKKKIPSLPLLGIKPQSSSLWPSHYTDELSQLFTNFIDRTLISNLMVVRNMYRQLALKYCP